MCGIVAMLDLTGAGIDQNELIRVRDAMATRGPDGRGFWISPDAKVGLAHRRLSLVDLSDAGSQPMASADASLRIVFNGEIYNYRELRRELEEEGFVFRSGSDTEVLLHLYACKGDRMLEGLRGMYAFVIWDVVERKLFVARDPFGIKPLYYTHDGRSVHFASQVKALIAGKTIDTSADPAGRVGFLLFGYVPEPFTLYRKIEAFPAGASMMIDAFGHSTIRYFCRIEDEIASLENSIRKNCMIGQRELSAEVRHVLAESVNFHLTADVPVGVFLSAGFDSAALAGLAAERLPGKVQSVTLGFDEYRGTHNDETVYAKLVANRYCTNHSTRWIKQPEFEGDCARIVAEMDQPSIDGINTYFVSKAAHELGLKTALSGLGGDELFGTYPSFRDVPRIVQILSGNPIVKAGRAVRRLVAPIVGRVTSPKYAGLLEYGSTYAGAYLLRRGLFMPWEIDSILPREVAREGWDRLAPLERLNETIAKISSERLKISALEMIWYMRNQLLRDSDWAGMAHSVEIRVPMVDLPVLRALVPRLCNEPLSGKRFLADTPKCGLPKQLLNRPKTGFGVPMKEWMAAVSAKEHPLSLDRGLRGWAQHLAAVFDSNI